MDAYIKSKVEKEGASVAYILKEQGSILETGLQRRLKRLTINASSVEIPLDPYVAELTAALYVVFRCKKGATVNIHSNNMSVVKWINDRSEPDHRKALMDAFRKKTSGYDVKATWEKKG